MLIGTQELSFKDKIKQINWILVLMITALAGIGIISLYSAGGGSMDPWASRQLVRFFFSLILMLVVAVIDIRFWYNVSYIIFGGGLLLLVIVEIMGHIGMGAQRWINLGIIQLQPSELMKAAVVMTLARYFHSVSLEDLRRPMVLVVPAMIIGLPVSLVLLQPDLGTSIMIAGAGVGIMFLAGIPIWVFLLGGAGLAGAVPIAWELMHEYQRKRVMTFLNPESDPLGSGYHIMQSKIALGSGGFNGKGFLVGTQSHLNFLPEKQTDFIFTLWAEEWGFVGGMALILLLATICTYCVVIALKTRFHYGRLLAYGLCLNFFLYICINIGMVMGLIPVVGAPLPLVSYGGTSMLTMMVSFGLVMSVYIHRDIKTARLPGG